MRLYYEDSLAAIYHGDNREVLPQLSQTFDLVITSPPYNLGEGMEDKGGLRVGHSGSRWAGSSLHEGYGECSDNMPYSEYVANQRFILGECWRLLSDAGAIYYNHKPRVVKGQIRSPLSIVDLPVRQVIIWNRGSGFNYTSGAYVPMCEWILMMAKDSFRLRDKAASGAGDVWSIAPKPLKGHPAPFPVELPTRILETTNAHSVLDPYAGAGTTLLAAKRKGIKSVGIELEERFCEMAAKRLSEELVFA